jgi:hypothetical protein
MWHNLNWLNEALFDEVIHDDSFESRIRLVLRNESSDLLVFLNYYIPRSTQLQLFTSKVCKLSDDFIARALQSEKLDNHVFDLLLKYIVLQDTFTYRIQNRDSLLTKYLENKEVVSNLFDENHKNELKKFFKTLNVKFGSLQEENNWISKLIYENRHYEINIHTIQLWLKLFTKEKRTVPSYKTILDSNLNKLKQYIESTISVFVENVLLKLRDQNLDWHESDESLQELLAFDNELLNGFLKSEIIKNVNFYEFNLKNYSEELWIEIVLYKKMLCSWENILLYCKTFSLDDGLLDLINTESWVKGIDKFKTDDKRILSFEEASSFWTDFLQHEITPKTREVLKNNFTYYFNTNFIQGTTNISNLKYLIRRKAFNPDYALDHFQQIKTHFKKDLLHMNFCLSYENELLTQLESPSFFKGGITQKELVFIAENNFTEKFFLSAISKISDTNTLILSETDADSIMNKIMKFNYSASQDFLIKILGFISEKNQPMFFLWIYDKIKFDKLSSYKLLVAFKGALNNLDKPLRKFKIQETDKNSKFVELLISIGWVNAFKLENGKIIFHRNNQRNFNS